MKERHKKTLPEKYGTGSVLKEFYEVWEANAGKVDTDKLFELLPYIGYLRIEVTGELKEWWYDANDEDWIRAKVLHVDENTVHMIHIDSHHGWIVQLNPKYEGFYVEGNVLRKN